MKTRLIVCLLMAAAGCGSDGDADDGDGMPPDPEIDLTEAVFQADRVLDIEIEMDPDDWDQLRRQTRSILDVLGSSCLAKPPERPFTYFPATVTIDGETVAQVGIRKKGFFGSLSEVKPSLKVKFSEYLPEQRYSGMSRLTLNNAISDPSYVKQCIGYDVFGKSGVPAPRCNFATVSVNGDDMGIYVNVESIKKQFLARHFEDNDGNMYEGALSDFRPGWVETFQKKTHKESPDRTDLEALLPVMETSDSRFLDDLEPLVAVDEFNSMWAAELLLYHADGYARNTNNFYIYNDPVSGKFHFIPWGIDSIMFGDATLPWEDERPPVTVWAEGVLTRRLYNRPESRQAYFDRLQELLDTVWNERDLLAEIDRMEALLEPLLLDDEQARFTQGIEDVRRFVGERRGEIEDAWDMEPSWSEPLRDPWCIDAIGTTSGSFETTWGTLDSNDPVHEGEATLAVEIGGTEYELGPIGALAGQDVDSGEHLLRLATLLSDTEILVVQFAVNEQLLDQGGTVEVDWLSASGYVFVVDFSGQQPVVNVVGIVGDGMLTLTEGGTGDGDPVIGSFDATIYESIF